jgi:hypothetical protein
MWYLLDDKVPDEKQITTFSPSHITEMMKNDAKRMNSNEPDCFVHQHSSYTSTPPSKTKVPPSSHRFRANCPRSLLKEPAAFFLSPMNLEESVTVLQIRCAQFASFSPLC